MENEYNPKDQEKIIKSLYHSLVNSEEDNYNLADLINSAPFDEQIKLPYHARNFSYLDDIYRRIENNKFMKNKNEKINVLHFMDGSLWSIICLAILIDHKINVKVFSFDHNGKIKKLNEEIKSFLDENSIASEIINLKPNSKFFDFNDRAKRYYSQINNICSMASMIGFKYVSVCTNDYFDRKTYHEFSRLQYFFNGLSVFNMGLGLEIIPFYEMSSKKLKSSKNESIVKLISDIEELKINPVICDNTVSDCNCQECRKIKIIVQ